MTEQVRMSEKVLPSFYGAWKEFSNPKYLHYYFKGGRGGSKSTTVALRLVYNRMRSKSHAVCVRKHKITLRHSIRNQVIWAIRHLEVADYWEWSDTVSGDMTIIYKPAGTKIFFEGADGDKIKGWKTPILPTTDIVFEEIADYQTDDIISSIRLSVLRERLEDGHKYNFFYTYNPPKRKTNWVNKMCESVIIPENTYIHHSDYRSNNFLTREFLEEAEEIRKTNPKRYDWEYLGKPIGSGIIPFENLEFRKITNEEIMNFDNLRQGLDWGYAADPFSFVRLHYDKLRRKIYIFGEIYGVKISNREAATRILRNKWNDTYALADSAEPKSIDNLRGDYNIKVSGAKKPAGSVETGEKWLDELEAIIIDPSRCPNTTREFENIDYETDRDGNIKSRLSDKNNHSIDAVRYSLSEDILRGRGGIDFAKARGWK